MNLTRTFSKVSDVSRKTFLGSSSRLSLLDHDEDSGGYRTIGNVTSGWNVSDVSEGDGAGDGQLKLEVSEGAEAVASILSTLAAVALLQPGWTVPRLCKVASRKEPLGEFDRTWVLFITPSGEYKEINE
jgi:hypothetical protein